MIFKVLSNPGHSVILQPTEEIMEKEKTEITTRGWATQMAHDCWLCPPIQELEDIKRSLWEQGSKLWMWDATEKVLWQGDFISVHTASCRTSGHCWQLLVSLSSTPSLQVFIQFNEITPESSSGWTIPVLSDTPHRRCSSPLIVFVDLNWTYSSLPLHHHLSSSFLTWHLHQAFHNPHNIHIQALSHLHWSQSFGSVFLPLQSGVCHPGAMTELPKLHGQEHGMNTQQQLQQVS